MHDPADGTPPRARDAGTWRRYLRFFGPNAVDDLDDELRFHVEMRVREYIARGMTEREARAATARRVGDLAEARSECATIATRRDRRFTRNQFMDDLRQDLAFALRTLGRNRGWTAVAIVTLSLGIGVNSAMFSVVHDLLLDPLPYPGADRVVYVTQSPADPSQGPNVSITADAAQITAWRDGARSLEALEPYTLSDMTLERDGGVPEVVSTARIQPSFAAFTGQRPIAGRMFTSAEAHEKAAVALLSEPAWRARHGSDRAVIGSSVRLNGRLFTIVGVMPERFVLPRGRDVQLWLPLGPGAADLGLYAVARLAHGVERDVALRELDAITAGLGGLEDGELRFRAVLQTPAETVTFRDSLVLLTAAVGLVLLIACANVMHLLMARSAHRQRELAIRSAIGAGTGRLFRQLVTESVVLALAGGVAGIVVGWLALRGVIASRPEGLAAIASVRMDGATLAVTGGIAATIALIFGTMGAVQARGHSASDVLKAGALTTSSGRQQGRARSLLVVTEMALCTTLLVAATLVLRSVHHLHSKDLGFDSAGMYWLKPVLPAERYPTNAERDAFMANLTDRLRTFPGVEAISAASAPPTSTNYTIGTLQRETDPDPEAGNNAFNPTNTVAANYFAFMGIPLMEGTTFTDTTPVARQVVVNEALARKLWPGRSAVGQRMRVFYQRSEWNTVVGVAANATTAGLTSDGNEPMFYSPLGHSSFFRPAILLRTTGDPRLAGMLAGLVQSIDAQLPPPTVRSVEDALRSSAAQPRFMMMLLGIFALVAVGLAAVGLYGVLAYSVAIRTREIGIRMALGASRRRVARSVIQQGLLMSTAGAIVGVVVARWGGKLLLHTLHGVPATDPLSFGVATLTLGVIAILACVLPARRAVSVDPMAAIRAD